MFGTDYLQGTFDSFETELKQLDNGWWEASALGVKAAHRDQSQAINDLNAKIDEKLQRGDLHPDGGM